MGEHKNGELVRDALAKNNDSQTQIDPGDEASVPDGKPVTDPKPNVLEPPNSSLSINEHANGILGKSTKPGITAADYLSKVLSDTHLAGFRGSQYDSLMRQLAEKAQQSFQGVEMLALATRRPLTSLESATRTIGEAILKIPENPLQQMLEEARKSFILREEAISNAVADAGRTFRLTAETLNTTVQRFATFQAELARTVQGAFSPMVQVVLAAQRAAEALQTQLEPFQRINQIFATLPTEQLVSLQESFRSLSEKFWFQWDETERSAFKLFTKLGLTGLESYLTRSELMYVLRLSKTKGQKGVQEYLFRKFRKDKYLLLNRIVRSWWHVPYLSKRKKTIRAAISAHKNHGYELAIPTLLPIIDGLASEIAASSGIVSTAIYVKEVAKIYNSEESEVYSECVERVVSGLIYRDYHFASAKKPPSSVNRHGILHGRVVDYGCELNSYRVILLLDVMVKIFQQRSIKALPKP